MQRQHIRDHSKTKAERGARRAYIARWRERLSSFERIMAEPIDSETKVGYTHGYQTWRDQ